MMFNELYNNIGGKIKDWAKWIFIVETISAICVGIGLLIDESILAGIVVLICGPVAAWVSTWLLYAFGEMVEDISLMRKKFVGEKTVDYARENRQTVTQHYQPPIAQKPVQDKQKIITHKWDHWDDRDSSFGQCEICGIKHQSRLFVEFDEDGQTKRKNLCFECFSKRDCRPVTDKN